MNFKILAIRPLSGCSNNVLNNLKPDTFYFFDDAYEPNNELNFIKKKEKYNELSSEFYYRKDSISNTKLESINIQAIVGKNGSGKSSIIEFLLRMLNNFFKNVNQKNNTTEKLIYVEGLVGELYFKNGVFIYRLLLDFKITELNVLNGKKNVFNKSCIVEKYTVNGEIVDDKIDEDISEYFFTMYINYSLYGLDENDYIDDGFNFEIAKDYRGNKITKSVSWLNKIFHKNDGYQTPVVIHPYREEAMIDVRKEKDLMKLRLSSLIFTNEEYRTIIPEYSFDEIRFTLKEKTPLDHYLNDIFYEQKKGEINPDIFEEHPSHDKIKEKINYLTKWIDDNKTLLDYIKETQKLELNEFYDLNIFLYAIYGFLNKIDINELKVKGKYQYTDKIPLNMYVFAIMNEPNFKQLIIEEAKSDLDFSKILSVGSYMTLDTLISLIQLSISYKVFINYFDYKKDEINFKIDKSSDKLKCHLFWYCVIKSVKTQRYNTHIEYSESFKPINIFNETNKKIDHLGRRYFADIIKIDRSHITEKLRRTILLLELIKKPLKGKVPIGKRTINFDTSDLIEFYQNIVNESRPNTISPDNWEFVRDIKTLGNLINNTKAIYNKRDIEYTDLLPPPIFNFDFYSFSQVKGEKIPLSKISSGQFQKIGLLSSIIYHLKNLDSINTKKHIYNYKRVLIILDEIELYFHPEQQRSFINDLIGLLAKNMFNMIESLNLIFITHSPFVLSDIPSQNVLKLEEGEVVKGNDINSFGANIHDLLADEFFLKKGHMGDFAEKKINELILLLSWKILYEDFTNLIANLEGDENQKKYIEAFELPYSTNQIEYLEVKKMLKENKGVKKRLISKEEIENLLPIKEYKIKNIVNYINSLKDEILIFINTIGEPLIKLRLIEMFNDSFKPNKQTELDRLLKERDILSKKIEKLELK